MKTKRRKNGCDVKKNEENFGLRKRPINKKARPKKSRPLLTYEKHQAQI